MIRKRGEGRENRPRSRHCNRLKFSQAESQETYPSWWKLTLFARESVAKRLALFARLFYWSIYASCATNCTCDFVSGVLPGELHGRRGGSSADIQARHEICDG